MQQPRPCPCPLPDLLLGGLLKKCDFDHLATKDQVVQVLVRVLSVGEDCASASRRHDCWCGVLNWASQ